MCIHFIFWWCKYDFFQSKHLHVTKITIQKLFNNIILHIFEFYLHLLFLSKFLPVLFSFFVVFLLLWIQFSFKLCNSTRRVTKFIGVSIEFFSSSSNFYNLFLLRIQNIINLTKLWIIFLKAIEFDTKLVVDETSSG